MKLLLLPILLFSPQSSLAATHVSTSPEQHLIQWSAQAPQPIRFIRRVEVGQQGRMLEETIQAVEFLKPQPLKPIHRVELG
jgi:hypothetical protein